MAQNVAVRDARGPSTGSMTERWLAPAIGFVIITGLLGITTKLALRHVRWQEVVAWTAVAYVGVVGVIVITAGVRIGIGPGNGWAALSGLFAAVGLVVFALALRSGPA